MPDVSAENKIWYVVIAGKADGPHEGRTIREWLMTFKLNYSDLVFREGLTGWVHISEIKEFERRTTERMKTDTVSGFDLPPDKLAAPGESDAWIALSKHGEGNGRHHYIQSGPFTREQVLDKLKNKEIKYDDHVWKKGLTSWTPIAEIADFKPADPVNAPKTEAIKTEPIKTEAPKIEIKKTENPKVDPEKVEITKVELKKTESPRLDVTRGDGFKPIAMIAKDAAKETAKVVPSKVPSGIKDDKFSTEVTQPTIIVSRPDQKNDALKAAAQKAESTKTNLPKPNIGLLKDKPVIPTSAPMGSTDSFHFGSAGADSEVTASGVPKKTAKTVVNPLSPNDKSAPPPSVNSKFDVIEPADRPDILEDPDLQGQDEEDASDFLLPSRRKRITIAAVGATLVMAIVYAGMSAFKDTLKTKSSRGSNATVATGAPPPPPKAAAPATVAPVAPPTRVAQLPAPPPPPASKLAGGALPDPFSDKPPVNPEVENPAITAKVLRVVPLKTASDRPQLAMETDLPGGSPIHIEITAASGAILKYPSFKLVKDIAIQPGSMPSVDLSSDHLQSGDYSVAVKGGGLTATAPLAVGVHDEAFRQALNDFKKVVALEQKKEKAELKDGIAFAARSYASITKGYHAARNPSSADSKRKWTALVKAWKKDFEQKARDVKSYNERTRNGYAYPDQLGLLKATEEKLLQVYRSYDNSLKAGRDVASDNTAPTEFKKAYKDLQRSLTHLK